MSAGASRMVRVASLALVLLLSACTMPRSGPSMSEIATADHSLMAVVPVTMEIARATALNERLGFDGAFVGVPPLDTARIAAGDVMAVTVWEGYDQGLLGPGGGTSLPHAKVDERGNLFVPYAGLIRAEGRTLAELRAAIRARLSVQTLEPQVDVFPADARGRQVSIQGLVAQPGIYPIEPLSTRLSGLLARAGGVAGDPETVRLRLRRGAVAGEIRLSDLYDEPANDVPLRHGDVVIAERDRRLFTALGAVGKSATVPFPSRELSVIRALGTVGGLLDDRADPTGVFILRDEQPTIARAINPGRKVSGPVPTAYIIDLTAPGGMFVARSFMLRDRDTLYVTNAPFVRWQKILQSIAPLVGFSASVKTLSGQP